jgi:hypothetical protein
MTRHRLSLLTMAPFAASLFCALPAAAQSDAPLGPQLQKAEIRGHGDTITIKRLPVRTPNGIVYRDITIQLKLDASGDVLARAATSHGQAPHAAPTVVAHDVTVSRVTETATAPEVAAQFTPGLYREEGSGALLRLTDEGRHLYADFPTWSLSQVGGDPTFSSARWYAGPMRTNPQLDMIRRAGITSDTYSYGAVTSSGAGDFDSGMLIGAVEHGKTLTLVSFHQRGCCTYSDTPTSQLTFTLIGK